MKKPLVTWTNSAGREFTWGYVGMPVIILRKSGGGEYEIVDLERAASPTFVNQDKIEKINVVWKVLR